MLATLSLGFKLTCKILKRGRRKEGREGGREGGGGFGVREKKWSLYIHPSVVRKVGIFP